MISVATIHNAEDFAGMRKAGQLAAASCPALRIPAKSSAL